MSISSPYYLHRLDIDVSVQINLMTVLTFMRMNHNHHIGGGWFYGQEEIRSNAHLIMMEIYGAGRCVCNACIDLEEHAIRNAELVFAGFRQYVESCAALPPNSIPLPSHYKTALIYLDSALSGSTSLMKAR